MDTIIIVFIIGMIIIIGGLIITEIHNHKIELSNNRQLKRYRYQQNCDMISSLPKEWRKYIHTEKKQGVRELQTLDDFEFVFRYCNYDKGERGLFIGPTITASQDEMIQWFAEIKRNYFSDEDN